MSQTEIKSQNKIQKLINEQRLWEDLMAIAELTQADSPYTRRSFSKEFIDGRNFLKKRFEEAGLQVRIDAGGNLIGRLSGLEPNAGIIMIGSHSDTVPSGGRFDGVAGVITALEIVRSFKEKAIPLRYSLEAIDFLAEEPSEFGLSCIGSRAMVGALETSMLDYQKPDGTKLSQAMIDIGGNPEKLQEVLRSDIKAFFELHIEQGPVLEANQTDIGIVTGIVKIRRIEIILKGDANHAGTTPMMMRQDAAVAASNIVLEVQKIAEKLSRQNQGYFVATVGKLDIYPNAANVIPASAQLIIDARSESENLMTQFQEALETELKLITERWNVKLVSLKILSDSQPTICDQNLRDLLSTCANDLNFSTLELPSGAGHDAAFLSRIAPSAMVFIPCKSGKSHASEEWATPAAIAAGAHVITEAILRLNQSN